MVVFLTLSVGWALMFYTFTEDVYYFVSEEGHNIFGHVIPGLLSAPYGSTCVPSGTDILFTFVDFVNSSFPQSPINYI